jgi:hypothetical protein
MTGKRRDIGSPWSAEAAELDVAERLYRKIQRSPYERETD